VNLVLNNRHRFDLWRSTVKVEFDQSGTGEHFRLYAHITTDNGLGTMGDYSSVRPLRGHSIVAPGGLHEFFFLFSFHRNSIRSKIRSKFKVSTNFYQIAGKVIGSRFNGYLRAFHYYLSIHSYRIIDMYCLDRTAGSKNCSVLAIRLQPD